MQMTPRRFVTRYGVGLAILALAGGIVVGFSQTVDGEKPAEAANMPPPPEVSVAQVVSRDVRQWDKFTGRVTAVETVELRPRVSGYVERVAYEEGQELRKGDLLFLIDKRSYRAAFDRAKADLERARSEAKLAASELVRAQTLVDARAISGEEFDARKAAATQGNAAVRAAEAALDRARLDLEFTEVRAPIDGRAGRAVVTVGNLAQADSTLLTTLVSLDPVHVYFEADEQTYLGYNELARRGERGESRNPVRVGLANETGYPHAGTLDFTDNQVDPRTGTIRARAIVPNPDRVFTPGLFARVQLEGSGVFHALLIDDKAVLTDQDRKYVYVLGPGNTAVRRDIELGRMVDGLRVVSAGLEPADQVIVHGVQKVFVAGMPVTPQVIAMGEPPRSGQKVAAL
jgi:multidrug efflux system membrane fusion protein